MLIDDDVVVVVWWWCFGTTQRSLRNPRAYIMGDAGVQRAKLFMTSFRASLKI